MIRRAGLVLLLTFGVWLISQIDLAWLAIVPIHPVNLILLTVIMVALVWGFIPGLWAAAIGGWLADQFSVLPASTHLVAMIGTVVLVSVIIRRLVATRSLISFLLTVLAGTGLYYGLQASWVLVWGIFQAEVIHPAWSSWILVAIVQSAVHPVVAYLVWLRLGRNRYAQANLIRQF